MTVWGNDLWANDVWAGGVWGEGDPDVTGVATHNNAAQIHMADASFSQRAVGSHVGPAIIMGGSGFFFESGLPADAVQTITNFILANLVAPGRNQGRGLDASQTLLLPGITEKIIVGASLEDIDEAIDRVRTHMLGNLGEFVGAAKNVRRVTDADSHQQKILYELVDLLRPFSSNP